MLADIALLAGRRPPAINLPRHDGPRATLIERAPVAGTGVAYGTIHRDHVLNVRAANMVLVGAAAKLLPLKTSSLEKALADTFARKGEAVVAANLKAFEHGRKANP